MTSTVQLGNSPTVKAAQTARETPTPAKPIATEPFTYQNVPTFLRYAAMGGAGIVGMGVGAAIVGMIGVLGEPSIGHGKGLLAPLGLGIGAIIGAIMGVTAVSKWDTKKTTEPVHIFARNVPEEDVIDVAKSLHQEVGFILSTDKLSWTLAQNLDGKATGPFSRDTSKGGSPFTQQAPRTGVWMDAGGHGHSGDRSLSDDALGSELADFKYSSTLRSADL